MNFTVNGNTWTLSGAKDGGGRAGGEFTGKYKNNTTNEEAYFKCDNVIACNISEFLSGRIYKALAPNNTAEILLAHSPVVSATAPDETGENIYVVSKFLNGFKPLYEDMRPQEKLGESAFLGIKIKGKFIEGRQINSLFRDPRYVMQRFGEEGYKDFPSIAVPSLLVNNRDMHGGNVGVVVDATTGVKKLVIIDYGSAFGSIVDPLNPHSIFKYFLSHNPFTGAYGYNHFASYPEDLKLDEDFVDKLNEVAAKDLTKVVDDAFSEMTKFYGAQAMEDFALRAGLLNRCDLAAIKRTVELDTSLDETEVHSKYTKKLFKKVALSVKNNLKDRQAELRNFASQLDTDLCIEQNGKKFEFDARRFPNVVADNPEYFKQTLYGGQKFKFRKGLHKTNKAALTKQLKAEIAVVFADALIYNPQVSSKYKTVDKIYTAIMAGELIDEVKACNYKAVTDFEDSLLKFTFNDELDKGHINKIATVITAGSDVNMRLPDGSKVIDHAKDFEVKELLVKNGSVLKMDHLKGLKSNEQYALINDRLKYLKSNNQQLSHLFEFIGHLIEKAAFKIFCTAAELRHPTATPAVAMPAVLPTIGTPSPVFTV